MLRVCEKYGNELNEKKQQLRKEKQEIENSNDITVAELKLIKSVYKKKY